MKAIVFKNGIILKITDLTAKAIAVAVDEDQRAVFMPSDETMGMPHSFVLIEEIIAVCDLEDIYRMSNEKQ